jgi:hypothetical protein
MTGYNQAQTMVHVLKECGDDLTRANIMKQPRALRDCNWKGFYPGVTINTSANDFAPIKQSTCAGQGIAFAQQFEKICERRVIVILAQVR